ncbi:MAG: hypothetical protein NTX08_12485 [Sphingobacteriales bacterium]|nr:hypothetical protein [Sphingobacteriales bacterium]
MSELQKNITRINEKLQQLLKQFQVLQKENLQQREQITGMQAQQLKDAAALKQMQEQVLVLKAAAGSMTDADKKEFEKNINRYMKEIDKCIGYLSE